jgi:hypothetical protein
MIPNSFTLLTHDIEVVIDNQYCYDNDCMGRFIPWENKIIIADRYRTAKSWRKYKESIVEHTFYHELMHCLLYYTGHGKLFENEQLVDALGGLLSQYEKSKC